MGMLHITGPAKSGKSLMGNAMRNTHIGKSTPVLVDEDGNVTPAVIYGALLIDDTQDGDPRYLLEKLMDGEALGEPGKGEAVSKPADQIKWKMDPMIIFVGDKIELLDVFEVLAPGFTARFGPVRSLPLA